MTTWDKLDKYSVPTMEDMNAYVRNSVWEELCQYLILQYDVKPTFEYSGCSIPGWNVKFKKAGRNLCTLYPMEGFFQVLIVIGKREKAVFEQQLPYFSAYLNELYRNTEEGMGQRWLIIDVEDDDIIEDVKKCIEIRRGLKAYNSTIYGEQQM